jgi:hypothetical protein
MMYIPRGRRGQMVHISVIEARLAKLEFKASYWFKPEIRELQHILQDDEQIINCVTGRYFGGFALLVATDRRLLLIDKKIPYLSIEDIRYDMISEINYNSQMFDSSIVIYTINKQHKFSSWKHKHHLRNLTTYAQQKVMELRQYQQEPQPAEIYQQVPTRPAPNLMQAYNYDQTLQLQPPRIPAEVRQRLPSPHIPRIVGAAAVNGSPNICLAGSGNFPRKPEGLGL